MTGHRAAAPLMGGVALLERAINYALGGLQPVTPAMLSWPTPCVDWNLRALLGHLEDSITALHEAIEARRVELDVPPPRAADPVAAVRDRARRLLGAWTNAAPGGVGPGAVSIAGHPVAAEVVTSAGAIEIAVHGWDVAAACGADRPLPQQLAADLLPLLPMFVTDADRPHRFAPPIGIPTPATPSDRVLAYLGRRRPN